MTTYAWPSADPAFAAAKMTFRLKQNARFNSSVLNGSGQGIALPGARWVLTIDLPRQLYADRARVEAFINRLNGVEHRAQIWDQSRAAPLQLSGSPLVNGALAQFANGLALDGTINAGANMLRYTREFGNAWWSKTTGGTGVVPVVTADAGVAPDGSSTADRIVFNKGAGATSTDQSNLIANAAVATVTGEYYLWAFWLKSNTASTYTLRADFAGQAADLATVSAGPDWVRYVCRMTAGAIDTARRPTLRLRGTVGTSDSADVLLWGSTMVPGLVDPGDLGPPAVTEGDWLSLPLVGGGNQVVQVVAPASGETISGIEFRPPLRAAVADNAAIGIVRPAALFRLADPEGVDFPRAGAGICPEISIQLVEEFS